MYKGLYEIFKHWYQGGRIYIYSDPHFTDIEMKELRKNYISDEEQIKRINSKVGKKDTIIFLGDIGNVECIKKIRGYKILILGNHDKGVSNYKREINTIETFDSETISKEDQEKIAKNASLIMSDPDAVEKLELSKYFKTKIEDNKLFDEVYEGPLIINDKIVLSHEPIDNLPSYLFNIHGHVHGTPSVGERYFNTCAEHIDYTPIALNDIIEKCNISSINNIHRVTIDVATRKKKK